MSLGSTSMTSPATSTIPVPEPIGTPVYFVAKPIAIAGTIMACSEADGICAVQSSDSTDNNGPSLFQFLCPDTGLARRDKSQTICTTSVFLVTTTVLKAGSKAIAPPRMCLTVMQGDVEATLQPCPAYLTSRLLKNRAKAAEFAYDALNKPHPSNSTVIQPPSTKPPSVTAVKQADIHVAKRLFVAEYAPQLWTVSATSIRHQATGLCLGYDVNKNVVLGSCRMFSNAWRTAGSLPPPVSFSSTLVSTTLTTSSSSSSSRSSSTSSSTSSTTSQSTTSTSSQSSTSSTTMVVQPTPTQQVQTATQSHANIPYPSPIKVYPDDRVATLQWETGFEFRDTNRRIPANWDPERFDRYGITGFIVSWGAVGATEMGQVLTPYTMIQLQPLTPGTTYQAQIRTVWYDGGQSRDSPPVYFSSNASRVDRLRSQMTGFFDDFNTPAGPLDERKWNMAFTMCDAPDKSTTFINNQFHAHNLIASGNERCDRGQVVLRPRALLDFTSKGVATVVFDLDGGQRMNSWYLDFLPGRNEVDLTGHVRLEDGPAAPIQVLRIKQRSQDISIFYFNRVGEPILVNGTGWKDNHQIRPLDHQSNPLPLIRNVRRPFVITFSATKVSVSISGREVLTGTLPEAMPDTKGTIHWTNYAYDLKSSDPFAVLHWDNFGFDGPASGPALVTTNNYKATSSNNATFQDVYGARRKENTFFIPVPDSVDGAIAARLMWVSHSWSKEAATADDIVLLNRMAYTIPVPVEGDLPMSLIISWSQSRAFNIPVEVADVKSQLTTQNGIRGLPLTWLLASQQYIGSVHLELDFPKTAIVSYTPPQPWFGTLSGPLYHPLSGSREVQVGLGAYIWFLGGKNIWEAWDLYFGKDSVGYPVSYGQLVRVRAEVNCESELSAYGKVHGLSAVRLLANNVTLANWKGDEVANMTYLGLDYTFNTSTLGPKFPGGRTYQIALVAYNSVNTPSIPDYQRSLKTGDYFPLKLFVS